MNGRAKLIDVDLALKKYKGLAENDPHEYIPPNEIVEDLESQPLVDAVEIVHSKWVWIPVAGVMKFRCGNIDCCRLIPFGCSPDDLKYCPYCGSIMDGEKFENHERKWWQFWKPRFVWKKVQ